jgi:hypothetical protein
MTSVDKYEKLIADLRKKKIKFDKGLNADEYLEIETFYDISFPKSLKEMYQVAVPVSHSFYNWRDFSKANVEKIKSKLEWPLEGVLFDVEENCFWDNSWGEKPTDLIEAKKKCIEEMKKVPRLLPIYSHRYIPIVKGIDNPPIFSVYQTDAIYYGVDLENYLRIEFGFLPWDFINEAIDKDEIVQIPFWSQFCYY